MLRIDEQAYSQGADTTKNIYKNESEINMKSCDINSKNSST